MNDLVMAINAALRGHGECVCVTRLIEADGTPHHTAHVHIVELEPKHLPRPQLLPLLHQLGCRDVVVAMVLQDETNGTIHGATRQGALHLTYTFQRADARARSQVTRLMGWLETADGQRVNHVSQANLLELAGIEPSCQSMDLLRATHDALERAGWQRYLARTPVREPYGRRPMGQWLYRRPQPQGATAAS